VGSACAIGYRLKLKGESLCFMTARCLLSNLGFTDAFSTKDRERERGREGERKKEGKPKKRKRDRERKIVR